VKRKPAVQVQIRPVGVCDRPPAVGGHPLDERPTAGVVYRVRHRGHPARGHQKRLVAIAFVLCAERRVREDGPPSHSRPPGNRTHGRAPDVAPDPRHVDAGGVGVVPPHRYRRGIYLYPDRESALQRRPDREHARSGPEVEDRPFEVALQVGEVYHVCGEIRRRRVLLALRVGVAKGRHAAQRPFQSSPVHVGVTGLITSQSVERSTSSNTPSRRARSAHAARAGSTLLSSATSSTRTVTLPTPRNAAART